MSPTETILSHWKAITPSGDVAQHEAGFRRVIEAAVNSQPFILPDSWGVDINSLDCCVCEPPQSIGDEVL